MAKVTKVKIFDNAGAKIYMDAKDKNVSANMIYSNYITVSDSTAFRDHECVVGYDADLLLEAFIKGALLCFTDELGGETLYIPHRAHKDKNGLVTVFCGEGENSIALHSIIEGV